MASPPRRLPGLYKEIIALSVPIAGIQFAQIALTTTDLVLMGLLGMEALAAGGLALLLYNQFRTMCVGMVTALGNLIAASIGRSERRAAGTGLDPSGEEEIRNLVRSAFLLATVVALAAGGLLIALSHCLTYLGQDASVAALAKPVMVALAPGLLPMVWLNVLRQFAVGIRRPGSLFWVTLASIAVNAILGGTFIFGWLGVPRLGLTGVGVSTTVVQIWTFAVYLRAVRRDPVLKDLLSLAFWRARPETAFQIAKLGWPISLTYGLEASITSVASVVIGTFGPVALAASNVVHQLAKIVYQINVGISHGASILVSRAIGQGQFDDIGKIARASLVICFVPMAVIGTAYLCLPQLVLWPFLRSSASTSIFPIAVPLLWLSVAYQFLAAAQNIYIGLLRGLGNTTSGLLNTLVGYWLIGVPAILICGERFGWEERGVWMGLCVAFGSTSLLLWRRFHTELSQLSRNK